LRKKEEGTGSAISIDEQRLDIALESADHAHPMARADEHIHAALHISVAMRMCLEEIVSFDGKRRQIKR